jgi:hypothetical protein
MLAVKAIHCDYCSREAKLVNGRTIYPHRPDLAHKPFYHCDPCRAWVGCHPKPMRTRNGLPGGYVPLGRLATAELRKAKMAAHAAFDPLWKSGGMSRQSAYAWLAGALGISADNCHIGMFDLDGCRAVVAAVSLRTLEKTA